MPLTHGFLDGSLSGQGSGFAFPPSAIMYRGLTLNEWAALGPRGYADVLRVLQGTAAALQGVHAASYVHRGVKPGNILLWGGEWALSDFGYVLAIGASVLRCFLAVILIICLTADASSPSSLNSARTW
jgi:serine/threonine protein kinase